MLSILELCENVSPDFWSTGTSTLSLFASTRAVSSVASQPDSLSCISVKNAVTDGLFGNVLIFPGSISLKPCLYKAIK